MLRRINCRSENSKGVYCLQYDDVKIVSGLRDNTIKIWDRADLQCVKVNRQIPIYCSFMIYLLFVDSNRTHRICVMSTIR